MSFGDPNNPYGQQPPQGQPGYGYPQQAPQGVPPQGGYAYPPQQAPMGYPGGPGGYPGMPMEMPGLMKTARVLLFIVAGLQMIIGLIFGIMLAAAGDVASSAGADNAGNVLAGLGFIIVIILFAFAAWAIFLGAKFSKGGSGIRITTIVYSALFILGALSNFTNGTSSGALGGIIGLAIGGIILASMVTSSATTWFNRPRY
ncbi:hypothetical protein [Streptomyces sp. NPDC059072]|uniref:hypothetical protein n=1 Tax=Streptomyces sp. NPDC059072 TaxID=3346715 RepID=UPI0036C66C0D